MAGKTMKDMTVGSPMKLILGFLELYEENCAGKDPESCSRWFRDAYGILDRYLKEKGNAGLRFLYFKALKGSE